MGGRANVNADFDDDEDYNDDGNFENNTEENKPALGSSSKNLTSSGLNNDPYKFQMKMDDDDDIAAAVAAGRRA